MLCPTDLGRCVLLLTLFAPAPFPRPLTAYLGVELRPGGLSVATIYVASPADDAQLSRDDVLVAIDDTPLRSPQDLADFLRRQKPGVRVTVTVRRDGRPVQAAVKLGTRGRVPYVGTNFDLDDDGIRVAQVADGSPASRAGIRVNDRIVALDGIKLTGPTAAVDFLRRRKPGEVVTVLVRRDNADVRLRLTLGERPGY